MAGATETDEVFEAGELAFPGLPQADIRRSANPTPRHFVNRRAKLLVIIIHTSFAE
jgi:hypothetical protein